MFVELLEQVEDLEIDVAVVPSRHAQITDERFDWSFVKVKHIVPLVPLCGSVRSHDFDCWPVAFWTQSVVLDAVLYAFEETILQGDSQRVEVDDEDVLVSGLGLLKLQSGFRHLGIEEVGLYLAHSHFVFVAVGPAELNEHVFGGLCDENLVSVVPSRSEVVTSDGGIAPHEDAVSLVEVVVEEPSDFS